MSTASVLFDRIRVHSVVVFCLLFLSLGPSRVSAQNLLDARTRDLLHEVLSGELAKEHVIGITRSHRIQGSRGYRDAANYVLEQLRAFGFDERHAFIESYPSDGRIVYQTWQSPSGWDIDRAELRMVEPSDERIVGYPEIAMSVVTYSNPGHARAELIFVGAGESDGDYEGKDVAGKIVLATGYGGNVHRKAVLERGALAVVCYLDDYRAMEYPDMLAYTGMWPRTSELDRVTFGFNLTNRQGTRLRTMLEAGRRVILDATVEGKGLEPFFMDLPVAVIEGTDRKTEELVLTAHLDHPKESANDNASGSAALLDMARSLTELIASGRLPRPSRTIRFIWVPEWYGTMAYIDAHPEMVGPRLGGRTLANINADMVGENLEILHSRMSITRTPDSIPSALNDVVENMAEMVDGMDIRTPRGSLSAFNYRVGPYGGGSDHMMFIDRGVPGMMIGHGPDYTHHTSEDTIDKVDPVELERSEMVAAGAVWYLANLTGGQARDLARLTGANSLRRLGVAGRQAAARIESASVAELPVALFEATNLLSQKAGHAREAVRSVAHFGPAVDEIERMVALLDAQEISLAEGLRTRAADRGGSALRLAAPYETPDRRVPIRLTRGPLDFGLPESRLPTEAAAWYAAEGAPLSGDVRFELTNFTDGTRDIMALRNLISAEFGPIPQEVVGRFFDDLVTVGVMRWAE